MTTVFKVGDKVKIKSVPGIMDAEHIAVMFESKVHEVTFVEDIPVTFGEYKAQAIRLKGVEYGFVTENLERAE